MPTCRACDKLLNSYEGKYNPETKEHDDLCLRCQGFDGDGEPVIEEIDTLYNYDIDIQ